MSYTDYYPLCPTCGKLAWRRHFNISTENPHLVEFECKSGHTWKGEYPE